jgi:D-arabinose 5-phosphate isomerase GutQ
MYKMTFRIFTLLALILATSLLAGAKRYEIKSGIVEYKSSGGGAMMGFTTKSEGSGKLYFTDYGNLELQERTEKETVMGRTTTSHSLTKIDHGTLYTIDNNEKVIYKKDITMLKQMDKEGKNLTKMGKKMMQQMGGKKVGTGKVLGYPCEIWELMGSKVWIYKGIPLKSESNIMGFKHTEVATKAKFNVVIPKEKFKLPDYPVKTFDQMMQEQMQKHPGTTAKHSAPAQPKISPEQMKQMQEMMKNLGKMFGGQQ